MVFCVFQADCGILLRPVILNCLPEFFFLFLSRDGKFDAAEDWERPLMFPTEFPDGIVIQFCSLRIFDLVSQREDKRLMFFQDIFRNLERFQFKNEGILGQPFHPGQVTVHIEEVLIVVVLVQHVVAQHSYPSMFDQNSCADIPGYSACIFFGMMEEAPYINAAANAWCRSSGKNPKRGFWAVEGEAGQISYFPESQDRAERGWRIASNWLLAANGARMLMFWKFGGRVTDTQTDQFNLTGFDGSVTERAELLSKSCRTFTGLKDAIAESCVHAEAAILFAPDTELARICDRSYKDYVVACQGAFRIMNELHIECDFIDERSFRTKRDRYKVIIAPETIFLNRNFADELKQFVADGGTLITDYRFAQKREDSMQFQTVPGHGLQEAAPIFPMGQVFLPRLVSLLPV